MEKIIQFSGIELKTPQEIEKIEISCKLTIEVLKKLSNLISQGITTKFLDDFAYKEIKKLGAKPAFLNYRGYPTSICTSINEEIVHGIPKNNRFLKEGDIIKIDLGVWYDGFYGDAAWSFPVGKASDSAKKLINVTKEALMLAFANSKPNNRLGDIGYAIYSHAQKNGLSVVKQFVGHGIGRNLHEEPQVPNYGKPSTGPVLKPGLVMAIEPMINQGSSEVIILKDSWTAITKDRKLSAHCEGVVAITEYGNKILTDLSYFYEI